MKLARILSLTLGWVFVLFGLGLILVYFVGGGGYDAEPRWALYLAVLSSGGFFVAVGAVFLVSVVRRTEKGPPTTIASRIYGSILFSIYFILIWMAASIKGTPRLEDLFPWGFLIIGLGVAGMMWNWMRR